LLGGVTREELAALSDADSDLIERRAVAVFAAVDRITAVIAEHDAGGAGAQLPAQRRTSSRWSTAVGAKPPAGNE
jgi:hypothetical protein